MSDLAQESFVPSMDLSRLLKSTRPPAISERFCAGNADIAFQSSDHVLFKIHSSNIRSNSEGFSPPEGTSPSPDDIVHLPEGAIVLDLLFQFMYPQRQPDLKRVEFEILQQLAEAAEKYQVFAAMATCKMLMEPAHKTHPIEVLIYAAKHDYLEIANLAAREAMKLPADGALERLLPEIEVYVAYTRYYAQWAEVLRQAVTYQPNFSRHNIDHLDKVARTLARLGVGPASLQDLDTTFQPLYGMVGCLDCTLYGWRAFVEVKIAALKEFTSFL